ncbi:nuclear transport factor 2 family protein [Nocardia colli]|uniref:Nuclear transport factor 2 family protein n=1 Tax=Nocardia colli TaxID=2545717 RepID=A0A5N0EGH6_9NOCA|nr:nuclear transport factor 2 family protein [Nocardia colli]
MDQGTGGLGRGDPSAGGGGQERGNPRIDIGRLERGDPGADEQKRREGRPRGDERKLDDVTAISRLKFRYLRSLDTKSWDEFADTMIPEATATYSEYLQFESRDAFLAFMRNTLGPHVITEHRCDHPEIDVDGDAATGTWYLADTVLIPGHNMLLRGAAFYSDEYVRCDDGRWRISHTGYERTYEVVLSLSDLPSLRLTSSRWGLISREDGVISSVERDPGAPPVRREPEAG